MLLMQSAAFGGALLLVAVAAENVAPMTASGPSSAPTAPVAQAVADAAGEWDVSFSTPSGPAEFTMYVNQEGTRLTGRLTSDAGEFPLRGTVDGDTVTITWTLPDGGRLLDVTFRAKVTGDE